MTTSRMLDWIAAAMAAVLTGAPAAAQSFPQKTSAPHVAGLWKGTAQKSICGRDAGSVSVTWYATDKPYNGDQGNGFGQVSGPLTIEASNEGMVALDFGINNDGKFVTNLSSHMPSVSATNSPFTKYWISLTPKDAAFGLGYYQTLSGTMTRPNFGCPQMGDLGETLTVTLKKE